MKKFITDLFTNFKVFHRKLIPGNFFSSLKFASKLGIVEPLGATFSIFFQKFDYVLGDAKFHFTSRIPILGLE